MRRGPEGDGSEGIRGSAALGVRPAAPCGRWLESPLVLAMLAQIAVVALAAGSPAAGADGDDPLLRRVALELGPEGATVEHVAQISGWLSIHARSEALDPQLVVEVLGREELLENDDSGGGTTAWLWVEVERGDALEVAVAAAGDEAGAVELSLVRAPETDATRAASERAEEELASIERLKAEGAHEEARARVTALVDELASTSGARESRRVGETLWRAGHAAYHLSALAPADRAWAEAHEAWTRLLPPEHPDLLAAKGNLALTRKALGDLRGALELEEAVLEAHTRLLPPEHPDLLDAKLSLAATRAQLGDLAGAHELFEAVHEARTRLLPPEHPDLLRAKQNLAVTRKALGDLRGAHELFEAVHEARTRLLPPEHRDLLATKHNLAGTRAALGDLRGALALEEAVHEAWTRLLPPDHPDLLAAKLNLALTRNALGDLAGALALFKAVHEARARLLPPEHPDLLTAKLNLAGTRKQLGDLAGALAFEEEVHEIRTRLLPPEHPDLLTAKLNLAGTRRTLGDLAGALALGEEVLETRTRLLPPDHPELLAAKQGLARTRRELGDLRGALALFEAVHEARARLLPPDHARLLTAKLNLALTRKELGDLASALELEEEVLEAWTRLLPPDHPDLLAAKGNLAVTRKALGDLAGAHALEEQVLEARARLLPPDHPDLLTAKQNLAGTRKELGDLRGAHALFEAVHEARARLLPPEHPDLLAAKGNLATTRRELGDLRGAHALFEAVHEARARLLPPEHPGFLAAKGNLAVTRKQLGDLAGALELEEEVLEAWTRLLPPDHPDLLAAEQNLAVTRRELGDLAGALELVSSLLAGQRVRAAALRAEAARPAREGARAELHRLSAALFSSESADSESGLEPELFSTLESLRLASVASAEAAHALAERPELDALARELAATRARLGDVAATGPKDEGSVDAWRRSLVELAEERDRVERDLRRRLAEAGVFDGEVDAAAVAARLGAKAALASFLRYTRYFDRDPETGKQPPAVGSLLAFVVRADASVTRVELGPTAEIDALVSEWRAALGKPIERGVGVAADAGRSEAEIGRDLRARILDRVLAAAGEGVETLHVVLDDVLFLVPLDALPLEKEEVVGERLAIRVEPTLLRLVRGERPFAPEGTLVALGGVDFDTQPRAESETVAAGSDEEGEAALEPAPPRPAALVAAATPPLERSGRPEAFAPLRQTRYEVEDVGAQYEEAFGAEPRILAGAEATKVALFAAAPKARFLHLATHGWFASESFKSQLDTQAEQSARDAFGRAGETLTGFAPETLCGLALAGANRGANAADRVPGIVTAEELGSFDLRGCELAVLSACETNVGIRRAGQGIQSLQTALHAAGARTAITSLWKVDDAATRRLFELFYTKLWSEKLGKADALWQAKMALRAEGHPPRDWAAWVLSGDPR